MATKIPLALGNEAWDMMATAQQIDQCCGLGRGVNLLDNWWFGKGVINQRGNTTYPSSNRSYFIDRWWMFGGGTFTLQDTGLYFTPTSSKLTMAQNFNPVLVSMEVPITASVFYNKDGVNHIFSYTGISNGSQSYINDGVVTICYGGGASPSGAYGGPYYELGAVSECTIIAAKLEIGTEQTLAHLEGDTWVLNDPPPNQALELLKCQRYFVKGTGDMPDGGKWAVGHHVNGAGIVLETPYHMRAIPNLSVNTNRYYWNGVWVDVTLLGVGMTPLGVRIVYTQSPSITATLGASVLLEHVPDLSADL